RPLAARNEQRRGVDRPRPLADLDAGDDLGTPRRVRDDVLVESADVPDPDANRVDHDGVERRACSSDLVRAHPQAVRRALDLVETRESPAHRSVAIAPYIVDDRADASLQLLVEDRGGRSGEDISQLVAGERGEPSNGETAHCLNGDVGRLEAFLTNRGKEPGLVLEEFDARDQLEATRPLELDRDVELDPARPIRHHENAVGQEDGLVDVVCHEEDREPVLLSDARQELLHELARLGVEGAERLVHEQYLWTVRERPGDGNTLAHPAGELARIRVGELVETDECEML